MSSANEIIAVVVTYHPAAQTVANLRALTDQVPAIVVDNTPTAAATLAMREIEALPRVTVLKPGQNLGIAAALNIGIRTAMERGATWVATFDQDSTVTTNFFSQLLTTLKETSSPEKIGLIAPRLVFPSKSPQSHEPHLNLAATTTVRVAMTSGSLLRDAAIRELGPYDEGLFIDYVDYDYCLRMQYHGYQIIQANHAVLNHRLGATQNHRLFGISLALTSHNAWRRYYITRNRILLYRRHGLHFPGWCLQDFAWAGIELVKIVLFEADKGAKLRNTLLGAWHGLLGKHGQFAQLRE
jgi:rhamnosyltransferase